MDTGDVNDPFIDDPEFNIDNRTHYAQTKQQGFYVSSGEVALMKDTRTPKKAKSKKRPVDSGAATAGPNTGPVAKEDGTKEHPINLLVDDKAGKKRKNYTLIEENGKKRKVVDLREFHPDLQSAIEDLKVVINNESWGVYLAYGPQCKFAHIAMDDFAISRSNKYSNQAQPLPERNMHNTSPITSAPSVLEAFFSQDIPSSITTCPSQLRWSFTGCATSLDGRGMMTRGSKPIAISRTLSCTNSTSHLRHGCE